MPGTGYKSSPANHARVQTQTWIQIHAEDRQAPATPTEAAVRVLLLQKADLLLLDL